MRNHPSSRAPYAVAVAALIAAGLAVRLVPLGLPNTVIRHGGNIVWGAMVLCLVAAIRPPRLTVAGCLTAASAVAIGSELFRLYHAPALDVFRHTLAGGLLIGRVFSVWNMLDYEIGIVLAAGVIRARAVRTGTWG